MPKKKPRKTGTSSNAVTYGELRAKLPPALMGQITDQIDAISADEDCRRHFLLSLGLLEQCRKSDRADSSPVQIRGVESLAAADAANDGTSVDLKGSSLRAYFQDFNRAYRVLAPEIDAELDQPPWNWRLVNLGESLWELQHAGLDHGECRGAIVLIRNWQTSRFGADVIRGLRLGSQLATERELVDIKIAGRQIGFSLPENLSFTRSCEQDRDPLVTAAEAALTLDPQAIVISVNGAESDELVHLIQSNPQRRFILSGSNPHGDLTYARGKGYVVRQNEEQFGDKLAAEIIKLKRDEKLGYRDAQVIGIATAEGLSHSDSPESQRWAASTIRKLIPDEALLKVELPELRGSDTPSDSTFHVALRDRVTNLVQATVKDRTTPFIFAVMRADLGCLAADAVEQLKRADRVVTADFDSGVLGRMLTGDVIHAACGIDPFYYGLLLADRSACRKFESPYLALDPSCFSAVDVKRHGLSCAADASWWKPSLRFAEKFEGEELQAVFGELSARRKATPRNTKGNSSKPQREKSPTVDRSNTPDQSSPALPPSHPPSA